MTSKPWTENWRAERPRDSLEEDGSTCNVELAAAAPALVRALLAVEWAEYEYSVDDGDGYMDSITREQCPACGDRQVHEATCSLDAALKAAGLPDQASRDAARTEIARRA